MTKKKADAQQETFDTNLPDAGDTLTVAQADRVTAEEGPKVKKPKEPKDVAFRRLANRRVPNALKRLRHIASLTNRNNYEYTTEQAARIVVVLKNAVADLERKFSGVKQEETWTL